MIKFTSFVLSSSLLLASSSVFSCDDKPCEIAYLNSSEQYTALQSDHAVAAQQERIAYAKVRENRQRKVNEQLVREARASLIRIVNNAIAQGKSMDFIEAAVKAAQESGAIKAEIKLHQGNDTATVEETETVEENSTS